MLLATHQQSSVAGQAASATQARRWHFVFQQCVNYSLLKKKVGVSDGRAGDDGNVKTLTVSIDAPKQLPLQSPIRPKSLVHRIYMYSPGAAVALVPSTDSTCERAGDINAPLECGLLILIACSSERAWVNSEGLE